MVERLIPDPYALHRMETPLSAASAPAAPYPLWALIRYFLRLGSLGFGGPVALIGSMHYDLVAERQ